MSNPTQSPQLKPVLFITLESKKQNGGFSKNLFIKLVRPTGIDASVGQRTSPNRSRTCPTSRGSNETRRLIGALSGLGLSNKSSRQKFDPKTAALKLFKESLIRKRPGSHPSPHQARRKKQEHEEESLDIVIEKTPEVPLNKTQEDAVVIFRVTKAAYLNAKNYNKMDLQVYLEQAISAFKAIKIRTFHYAALVTRNITTASSAEPAGLAGMMRSRRLKTRSASWPKKAKIKMPEIQPPNPSVSQSESLDGGYEHVSRLSSNPPSNPTAPSTTTLHEDARITRALPHASMYGNGNGTPPSTSRSSPSPPRPSFPRPTPSAEEIERLVGDLRLLPRSSTQARQSPTHRYSTSPFLPHIRIRILLANVVFPKLHVRVEVFPPRADVFDLRSSRSSASPSSVHVTP
ncbi:hypothetical protein PTTG_30021, partial [Puccinia triticina 1-1 BBBD Race 1]